MRKWSRRWECQRNDADGKLSGEYSEYSVTVIGNKVESAMSSHSYEQPTSYGRSLGHSPKWHFLYNEPPMSSHLP